MINVIFYFNQLSNEISKTKEYTTFILKNNSDLEDVQYNREKYSDNITFVILKSDVTEYTLAKIESQLFHDGLYGNKASYIINGINYDSFNLDKLYNPLNNYSTFEEMRYDLQYFSALYLYKALFQSTNFTIIKKEKLEVYLYHFSDEQKIKQICGNIDFSLYKDYLSKTDIDCWDEDNILYYDEKDFKNFSTSDSNCEIPYCGCLPLFCLQNAKTIKDEGFANIILASKINLPSKCQNKFISYDNDTDVLDDANYDSTIKKIYTYPLEIPKSEYLKVQIEKLHQMQGYLFLIITKVHINIDNSDYNLHLFLIKAELLSIVLFIPIIAFIVIIIIIYISLKKISSIIIEFKQKFELFIFEDENKENNYNKFKRINKNAENKKTENNNLHSESASLMQNDISPDKEIFNTIENTLLDELFTIFCRHYKISLNDVEKYCQNKEEETKNELKIKMMKEKNELFTLLALFSVLAPIFRLNLSLDYKMYNYSKIIKNYDLHIIQMVNVDKEQTRLTQNILYELLSTETVPDYGLITNLNFKYITNLNAELKENSIQNCMYNNIMNKLGKRPKITLLNQINNDFSFFGEVGKKNKLIWKKRNELMEIFKDNFEGDDNLDSQKIENSFNFFLVNSYYKYLRQIVFEGSNN
jgi:hypothetical protein